MSEQEEVVEIMAAGAYEMKPVGVREWRDCPTREACGLREQMQAAITALEAKGYTISKRHGVEHRMEPFTGPEK